MEKKQYTVAELYELNRKCGMECRNDHDFSKEEKSGWYFIDWLEHQELLSQPTEEQCRPEETWCESCEQYHPWPSAPPHSIQEIEKLKGATDFNGTIEEYVEYNRQIHRTAYLKINELVDVVNSLLKERNTK